MFLLSCGPNSPTPDGLQGHGAPHLLLTHGASQPVTSPFFDAITAAIAERGIAVHRFEFAYMAQRREGGSRRPPPRIATLLPEFVDAVEAVSRISEASGGALFIGGKSMGGRISSLLAEDLFQQCKIRGWAGISYPFHPVKKPEKLRTAHLLDLRCPSLIVQGERDPFGTPEEVSTYGLSSQIALTWMPDGDHDLKPRKRSGVTWDTNLTAAGDAIADFIWSRLRQS
ncbi:MAG: alpha/beta family hydrolase [Pseudomonadota bacterium]